MIRKAYIRKIENRIARLEEDIDRLRDRMGTSVGEIGHLVDREIQDLRSKTEEVRKRIRAVGAAEATNWGRLKNAVDEGLKGLGQAIDKTLDKLRKTGSGGD